MSLMKVNVKNLYINNKKERVEERKKMEAKKHFVLVHGGGHGGWCWYKLATLLNSAGHRVTAPDLAASGINTKQISELKNVYDYHKPLMEMMESLPSDEKVVLVGHSFGGVGLSLAMETFPQKIEVAVFVTASMLSYNTPWSTMMEKGPRINCLQSSLARSSWHLTYINGVNPRISLWPKCW
eukprot:TRINITY_DN287_c0_g1_i6.p1 TRINITY_DN287_c0_g1~~TRINITY_DN287_c0_g1_i6.p1  ORF type:complete len:182 (+),score=15.62 TRINITY_DN287_c0_g1_i6:85-630(+)